VKNDFPAARETITALLQADRGDEAVLDRLLPLVYDELRRMARGHLLGEREDHTLDATALVHEAYLKLVDQTWASAESRGYFFGAAARAMRQILVDHARQRMRLKRGGKQRPITLEEHHLVADEFAVALVDMDDALRSLAGIDPRAARVVECRFFGGLSVEETAEVLGISVRTVKRDWILAKAWLYRKLQGEKNSKGSA
jgi:RNA polymerase sigma-70 factor (ECF subfamily)